MMDTTLKIRISLEKQICEINFMKISLLFFTLLCKYCLIKTLEKTYEGFQYLSKKLAYLKGRRIFSNKL